MSKSPDDPNTKPSRLKRRRKRRWKISSLTNSALSNILSTAGTSSTGRGNLAQGEKIAAVLRGFFMSVVQNGVMPFHICYGGLITGSVRRWLHLVAVFHPVFSPSPDTVESISGGYILTQGATA